MKAWILSHSMVKFKEYWEDSLIDLIEKVSYDAIAKSGIQKSQIDYLFLGNCFSALTSNINNLQHICENKLGIKTFLFSGTENCSAIALNHGTKLIDNGNCKNIMVVGAEKLSDLTSIEQEEVVSTLLPIEMHENGFTLASIFAFAAKKYMQEYKLNEEDMAKVSYFNHKNGSKNPLSKYNVEFAIKDIINSTMIAEPIHLLDSAPYSDGAAAVILSNIKTDVSIADSSYNFGNNFDCITNIENRLKQMNCTFKEISVAEVYDNFSITELMSLEKMGFCNIGKGLDFLEENFKKINPSGGLKSNGNAFSANSLRQIIEVTEQLNRRCGERQIEDAKIGLTLSLGLMDNCVINIMKKNG